MATFRFQNLEIWQMALDLGDKLFDIAEGSGCPSDKEFARFLDIARRSAFENANIVIVLFRRKLIDVKTQNDLLEAFDHLSRRISSFKQTLKIE